jgi:pimeloyl-ACP methyl ester carboxylesterase
MSGVQIVLAHARAGRIFTAGGVRSFVRETASGRDGEPVVCLHGVPTSSFLWRNVLTALEGHGLHGVAFDLPGLGLADRPRRFDFSWTGLGRWTLAALDALDLHRIHLVVHDIGGPVGFEVAAAAPERIRSLTVLNTLVRVDTFRRPWPMEPFAHRGVGEVWLRGMNRPGFRQLMRRTGILDQAAVSDDELDAHLELLRRGDRGRAFLQIMRSFERTPAKRDLYARALRGPYPVQIVWGDRDPFLRVGEHGEHARLAAGLPSIHTVPARHFVPEDQGPAVAAYVRDIALGA